MVLPNKQVFYEDGFFKLEYEVKGSCFYLHCNVFSWKPSTLKNMYNVFVSMEAFAKASGMDKICTISPNPKFAKLFGGDVLDKFKLDGIDYEVIVWDLNYLHMEL